MKISSLEDMKSELEERLFDEEGHCNSEVLDQFLEMDKKINYAKGAVIRMIKEIDERYLWKLDLERKG